MFFKKKQETNRFFISFLITTDILLFALFLFGLYSNFILQISPVRKTQRPDPVEVLREAKKIATDCIGQDREKCYKQKFDKLVAYKDIYFAEQTLYALQDIDPITRQCHVLSHEISKAAVRNDPASWEKLLNEVDINTCGAGFFHGVLEAHVGYDSTFQIDSALISKICLKGKQDFRERTCTHIMGHLIVLQTEGSIDKGIPICEALPDMFALECGTGIFMEDSFKLILAEHGLAKIPVRDAARMKRQQARCEKYNGRVGSSCWIDLAEIFAEYYIDPAKVYDACYQAPEKDERERCYLKAVILMASSPILTDISSLNNMCIPYQNTEEQYKLCNHFIISSLMHFSPKYADRGVKFCSAIDELYRADCFKDLGKQMKENVSSIAERRKLCVGTSDKYQNMCMNI